MKSILVAIAALFSTAAYAQSCSVCIDVIHVDMPVTGRTAELAGCWTQASAGSLVANCGYSRAELSTAEVSAAGPGPVIEFAAVSTNFEWFVETGGPCVLVSHTIGKPWHENRYVINCGDVIARGGFEP